LLLETVPLYLLFEVSVLIATIIDRRARRATAA
jgi:Sec-independent protein secretion pathway component TatC